MGIPLYTASVVAAVTLAQPLGLPLWLVCGPMFFGDPLAAIVGRATPEGRFNTRFAGLGGKSVAGSGALFAFCMAWFRLSPAYAAHAPVLSLALTAAELLSGDYDNLVLVGVSGALLAHLSAAP